MKSRLFYFIFTLMMAMGGTLDASSLNRVTVNGRDYYQYEVKRGDTMFGLAQENDWDLATLQATNPGALSPLPKGRLLYYPYSPNTVVPESNSAVKVTKEENGKPETPLFHIIAPGETLFGISRIYGIPVNTLYSLNPGSKNGIKAGDKLILSDNSKKDSTSEDRYHNVQKGETLFGLSKKYNVSIESILLINPGLTKSKLRAGEIIKIPEEGTGIVKTTEEIEIPVVSGFSSYKARKDDTWESIAASNGIDVNLLLSANKGVTLKRSAYIGIPILSNQILVREVVAEDARESSYEGIRDIYEEAHGMTPDSMPFVIKIALVLDEPSSKKDTEFLRGFLTGIDKLKEGDAKIELKVLDGSRPASEIKESLDSFTPTLMVSSAERMLPDYLVEYAEATRTMLVNTFDVRNEQYLTNPYVIQLITPSDYFNDEVAMQISKQYDGYTLVFVGDKDENDSLAEALRKLWDPSKVRDRSVVDLTNLPLSENAKYLMYSYPTKKNEVSEFLSAVESAYERQPLAVVTIVGRPNWVMYVDALGDKYNSAGVLIPSRFYMNKDDRGAMDFSNGYKEIFDRQLMKSFPSYGAVGYDTALYFIGGLTATRGDFNALPANDSLVQSCFFLVRPSNWSGLVNTGVFILRHRPFGDVEKIIVK